MAHHSKNNHSHRTSSSAFHYSPGLFKCHECICCAGILGSPVRFRVLTTQLFRTLNGMSPGYGFLIALVMIVIGALILTVNQILVGKRKSFATVTGKSLNISLVNLKKIRTPLSIILLVLLLLITIVPLITFAVESFMVSSGNSTAENFTTMFWERRRSTGCFKWRAGYTKE